ncbi:NADPH:quinone reductase [Desertihabitans brevis]|uniref:NADPH:quinone reductase n=1 Tax=Desertihabitans brevis TaxID=2268447 RepID=A0A367Z1Q2_9ACTN|nr:zinc-binding dehydrogenase [Desertihabitans brevis]RCK71192.1 NADPH:quinone reductase [Desertihabitans brevis]
MKAIVIEEFGAPEGLALVDIPEPSPSRGEVVIAPAAIGVGGVDVMIRRGMLGAGAFPQGHIPGSEVAGTVASVGDGVDPSLKGRRVWAFTGTGGAYAERAIASVDDVTPLPDGLPPAAAVTLGGSGLVAHFGLAHARLVAQESVLVRGAAGSIGIAAVQFAARTGARAVAVTTSSPQRGRRLRALGATHVLDRAGDGGPDSPDGYDVIIDVVAGEHLPDFIDRLNPGGRYVAVGAVAGMPPATFGSKLTDAFQKSMSFATFSTAVIPHDARQAVRAEQFDAVRDGRLEAVVHEALPLGDAVLAHRKMDAGEVFGRIVLEP